MKPANTSNESRTIFLVNDDSSTVNLYSRGLEQAGFRTASAFNTETAFEALPNLCADLIIVDLMLPKRGGFQLLEAIRQDTRHKDTPVLVLSNTYLPELAQRALRAGGNKALPRSECTSSDLISASRELVGVTDAAGSGQAGGLAEQLKKDLMEEGSGEVAAIRQYCLKYVELAGREEAKEHLEKVYQSVRFLSTRAGLAGCGKIAQLTGAIEEIGR